jgi:hypothetical protein
MNENGKKLRLSRLEGSVKNKTKNNLKCSKLFLHLYLLHEITYYFKGHSGFSMYFIAVHEFESYI